VRHVLIVDDLSDACRMLAALVSHCGHRVTCANSGEEALAVLARDPADLVILDAMMPDMDGPEVLRRIRADGKTVGLPVVMLSAVADHHFREHLLRKGANDYWLKASFDYSRLCERLKPYLPCAGA
jgi:CheY-like chemotaxis protein